MHDYIFSRFLSTDTERGDDHPDILFGGKDSILPPKREKKKRKNKGKSQILRIKDTDKSAQRRSMKLTDAARCFIAMK